jgi:hypothetical protein
MCRENSVGINSAISLAVLGHNAISSINQHSIIAVQRRAFRLSYNASSTARQQFPPDLRPNLMVTMSEEQI